ncbi:MAG TPA: hypothetical protein IAC41_07870 [Candidatus Merdenecus merdavium]|nr:hypothetical protein [Candidatus Merdenecus merdavium]
MKEKIRRMMQGTYVLSYGVDPLNKFLEITGLIFMLISIFTKGFLLPLLAWICIILSLYRSFSKNHMTRYKENQNFLKRTNGIRTFITSKKYMASQRLYHRIYTCPTCHQKIRVPKGKGKIEVRCPKCNTRFIKVS